MKGVKAEKLKCIKSTSKCSECLYSLYSLWLPSVIACFGPVTWSLSCEPPTSYYNCTGEKDPCKTYRWRVTLKTSLSMATPGLDEAL